MAGKSKDMKKILELRDREMAIIADLSRKIESARERIKAFDDAVVAMGGSPSTPATTRIPGTRTTNVKNTVLGIVNEAGALGVTATEVVERSALAGKPLVSGSVSSLLSRYKREGALTFDGERYRPVTAGASVHVLKTVG